MPRLINISTTPITVGGWQKDEVASSIPLSPDGRKMSLPVLVQPGGYVEVSEQSLDHPIVRALVSGGSFKVEQVELVPGVLVADPSDLVGQVRRVQVSLTDSDLANAGAVAATARSLGAVPTNIVVLDLFVEVSEAFAGGSVSAITATVGTAGSVSAVGSALNLAATGLDPATMTAKNFAVSQDLIVTITASGDTLDALTAGAATVTLVYVAVE